MKRDLFNLDIPPLSTDCEGRLHGGFSVFNIDIEPRTEFNPDCNCNCQCKNNIITLLD